MNTLGTASHSSPHKNWSKMEGWDLVLPPSRPSKAQVHLLDTILKKRSGISKVLVLGTTTEYINLALLHSKSVVVIDKNKEYSRSRSVDIFWKGEVAFVYEDWITALHGYKSSFDLILSDLTCGNLSYEMQIQFWDSISNALTPSGLFFDKILTHPNPLLSISNIYNKYSRIPLNLESVNHFSCEALFCSEVLYATEKLETDYAYQQLESYSDKRWWQELVLRCKSITPEGCIWYYGMPWERQKLAYQSSFKIQTTTEDFPGSPYLGRVKILISSKA